MKFPSFHNLPRSQDDMLWCAFYNWYSEAAAAAKEINRISCSVFRLVVANFIYMNPIFTIALSFISSLIPSNDIHSYISIFSRICDIVPLYVREARKMVIDIIYIKKRMPRG